MPRLAAGSGSSAARCARIRMPIAQLTASLEVPVSGGRSRGRVPSAPRTRSTFALIARDRPASRSYSKANDSSTRDSSADSGSPARSTWPGGRERGVRSPAEQGRAEDRQAVGQPGIKLAGHGHEGLSQPVNLVGAEAFPPALLDEAGQRQPHLRGPAAPRRWRAGRRPAPDGPCGSSWRCRRW